MDSDSISHVSDSEISSDSSDQDTSIDEDFLEREFSDIVPQENENLAAEKSINVQFFSKIRDEIISRFESNNIDREMLGGHFKLDAVNDLFINNPQFSLCHRMTSTALIEQTVQKVKNAQIDYNKKLSEATELLCNNISQVLEIDSKLGVPSEIESSSTIPEAKYLTYCKLLDGTMRLSCPILHCSSKSFKLNRHLISHHENLSTGAMDYAVFIARKMERNKLLNCNYKSDKNIQREKKKKGYKSVSHSNVRGNLTKCSKCQQLYSNIHQHIVNSHGLTKSDSQYAEVLAGCIIVPKVLTKKENGRYRELEGEELELMEIKYGAEIKEENEIMKKLKQLREDIAKTRSEMKVCSDIEKMQSLTEYLVKITAEYKTFRYRDTKKYSEKTKEWHTHFEMNLIKMEDHTPKRSASMAIEIMLGYEQSNGPLMFSDILDGRKVREMIVLFRKRENLKATSKIKYLKAFFSLVEFLFTDVDSPEKHNDQSMMEKLLKDSQLKEVQREVEKAVDILRKHVGPDLAESREKTENLLFTVEHLEDIRLKVRVPILKLLSDDEDTRNGYSISDILHIRNCLMVVACINLARRSTELATMTLSEMAKAEKTVITNGDVFFVVKVMKQKSLKSGRKAAVAFREDEFTGLQVYVNTLRVKLCVNSMVLCVFPSTAEGGKQMTLPGVSKIFQKFKNAKGVSLGTTLARKSKVTINRASCKTYAEIQALANAMGHDVATAERYYNLQDLVVAANSCLSTEATNISAQTSRSAESSSRTPAGPSTSSTPAGPSTSSTPAGPSTSSTPAGPCISSTPASLSTFSTSASPSGSTLSSSIVDQDLSKAKRRVHFESDSDSSDVDITIVNLRHKRVKTSNIRESIRAIELEIEEIMSNLKKENKVDSILGKTGIIKLGHFNKMLSPTLKKEIGPKELRNIIKKYL